MCKVFSGFLSSEEIVNLHLPSFTGWMWTIQFICFSTVSAQARGRNATHLCGHSPGGMWGSLVSPGQCMRRDRRGRKAFCSDTNPMLYM